MKKLFFITTLFCLLGTSNIWAQFSIPQIQSMSGNELCAGTEHENQVHVAWTSGPPIFVPANAHLTYTWSAQHANGVWVWSTNFADRMIPLPWPGEYKIKARVKYVNRGTGQVFAAFWSEEITVLGLNCTEEEGGNY